MSAIDDQNVLSDEEKELRESVNVIMKDLANVVTNPPKSAEEAQRQKELKKTLFSYKDDIQARLEQLKLKREGKNQKQDGAKLTNKPQQSQARLIGKDAIKDKLMQLVDSKKIDAVQPELKPRLKGMSAETKRDAIAKREREIIGGARQMMKDHQRLQGKAQKPFNKSANRKRS